MKKIIFIKRPIDVVISLFLLLILSPLLILIGLLNFYTSGWPIIIKLDRIGYQGKKFKIYKFRSMINGADFYHQKYFNLYNHKKNPHDPRITPFGHVLRKTSIDELPQLYNVLKGDMSLIGPRPRNESDIVNLPLYYKNIKLFKPGMTGLCQINGRDSLSVEELILQDQKYVLNWSPWLDVKIIFKTIIVVLKEKNSY